MPNDKQSRAELVERLREDAEYIDNYVDFIGSPDRIARTMLEAAAALQSKDEQIERLTRERDEVSSSLEYLLVGYVGRYCDPVPEWQPLPTLGGIISQLDNAMTVTTTFKDRAEDAEQQVQKLTAENERLREAMTPSVDTNAAYMGEFSFGITLSAGGEEDYRRIMVPWTTIKEIMAAIRDRAALQAARSKE